MDIKESLNALKRLPQTDYETKVLYEGGLSKYQVHKLVETGVLVRVKRGHYQFSKNGYQAMRALEKGMRVAKNKRYTETLACFKDAIALREDTNEDLTMACIISLVRTLSGMDEYDALLSQLSYQDGSDYLPIFTDYKRKIIAGAVEDAIRDYYDVKTEELSLFGHIRSTTHNIHNLSLQVYDKKMLSYYQEYAAKRDQLTFEEEKKYLQADVWRKRNFGRIYERLMASISLNDRASIKRNMDKLIVYVFPKYQAKWQIMYKLLDDAEAIKKGLLSLKKASYPPLEPKKLFDTALANGDYLTAFEVKDLVEIPRNDWHYFNAVTALIGTLVRIDAKTRRQTKTPTVEVTPKVEVPNNVIPKKADDIESDIKTLEQLVYDKDYEKALELCYKYRDASRKQTKVFNNARKLIVRLLDVQKYNANFSVIDPDMQYRTGTIFSNFYTALENLDFKKAYELALACEKYDLLIHQNAEEFHIYALILDDLVKAITEYEHIKPRLDNLKVLRQKIKDMFYQTGSFTPEELEEVASLIQEKDCLTKEVYGQNYDATDDMNLLRLIRLILKTKSNYGATPTYFNPYELENASLIERFLHALYYGDYQTAFVLCQSDEWTMEAKNNFKKPYPRAYKKLLWQLKTQNVYHRPEQEEITHIEVSGLDDLKMIRHFLKKRKFKEAYDYYLNHPFPHISDELNGFMKALLPYLAEYEDTLSKGEKQYQLMPKKED